MLNIWCFVRISLPCYWICPPWKFTGLPSEKQSTRDRPSICYCQQYRLYAFLAATSAFCSRCCQRDGLLEPETGQSSTLYPLKAWQIIFQGICPLIKLIFNFNFYSTHWMRFIWLSPLKPIKYYVMGNHGRGIKT